MYVSEGAEGNIESTLRFLLSPKSAYVSAQVMRVGKPVGELVKPADWAQPLAGKKVLVTGASRGIGAAIAEVMARDGAQVICLDVPQAQEGLNEVAKKLGGTALALDIGAADAPQKLVDAAKAQGGWDVIVHNAGITRDKTVANMKEHLWQMVVNVNLSTQERINDALVSSGALKSGGRIVCVSSMSAQQGGGVFGGAHYCAAKAGVLGLVRAMARELGPRAIRVNAVAPGLVLTDFSRSGSTDEQKHATAAANGWPLRRAGSPAEIAGAILFLASDLSTYVTGTTLDVNGGAHMR